MACIFRGIASLCVAMFMIAAARAADVSYSSAQGLSFISITGPIVEGDSDKFNQLAASMTGPVVVALESPGGALLEGLVIGEAIRAKGYSTAVFSKSRCASTCGLNWLAGKIRYVGTSGEVGFHAAYTGSGDEAKEIGSGNAIIGAYLTKLGLSYNAVLFVTSAHPDGMSWLHPTDAQENGINVVTLPDPVPEQPRPATPPLRLHWICRMDRRWNAR